MNYMNELLGFIAYPILFLLLYGGVRFDRGDLSMFQLYEVVGLAGAVVWTLTARKLKLDSSLVHIGLMFSMVNLVLSVFSFAENAPIWYRVEGLCFAVALGLIGTWTGFVVGEKLVKSGVVWTALSAILPVFLLNTNAGVRESVFAISGTVVFTGLLALSFFAVKKRQTAAPVPVAT